MPVLKRFLVLAALACGPVVAHGQAVTPTADVTPLARSVVEQLARGDFAGVWRLFGPEMRAAMTEDALRAAWAGVTTQAGPLKAITGVRAEVRGPYRVGIVTCQLERALVDVQLVFDSTDRIAGLFIRPSGAAYTNPPYANPSAYTESDVEVGAAGWPLPGTLTMPNGPGPFPVVVLVHGSGAVDRDTTIGPNKVFKDLALGLASQRVAVLRYEKRTKQFGGKVTSIPQLTVQDETIDDVLAAVVILRRTPRIDPNLIVVAGHSLGGMLAPRIGHADPAIAGLIVLAGAARPLQRAILEQTLYLAQADGTVTAAEQRGIEGAQKLVEDVERLAADSAASTASIAGLPISYWLDLRNYDPPAAAASLTQPMLVLQGERDYQVTMAEFERWRKALAGRTNVAFRSYPALNHLFLSGTGASLPAEYNTPGHVPLEVITDIARWVAALK